MNDSTFKVKKVKAAGEKRVLNARQDPPDIRDRWYEPALVQLQDEIDHRVGATILDQGQEGACTGFACAQPADAVRNGQEARRVAWRML
jgi:hypothetical protein